ncbi:MAG: amino acid hydroxylase [Chloroflexaceae bacterium]|jgi:phenylalanine-4-hydroxylase|nr:amino acid hydroxylase [Chloroflexaceae bacterium]
MTTIDTLPTMPNYTEEDHTTWATLYARQMERMPAFASRLFLEGFPKLQLDPQRLPDPQVVSERLHALSGWTLGDAENEYLGPDEWFAHIAERRFPVTNYIRKPQDLEFTPLPDLFHEYFGHLAFFTNRRFGDIAQTFGPLYFAGDERQRLEIARLWWFTTEFGLMREDDQLKAFGAGLLSSIGEMDKAFAPETPRLPFDIRRAATMPSAVYEMHQVYFILDDLEHIARIIHAYAHDEGLPVPDC